MERVWREPIIVFWGQDEAKMYETDVGDGAVNRYKNELDVLNRVLTDLHAQLADPQNSTVRKFALERTISAKKAEQRYFKTAIYKTEHRFHELFGELTGKVASEVFANPESKRAQFLSQELNAMFFAPNVEQDTERYFGEGFTVMDLYLKITDPTADIPADFLYRVLKNHHEEMRFRAEQAEAVVGELKKDFLQCLQKEIDAGKLPLDIETAKQRLSQVSGKVKDRLDAPDSKVLATHAASGAISIYSSELDEEEFEAVRATVFHEFVHELAGKSTQIVDEANSVEAWSRIRDRKNGVRLMAEGQKTMTNRLIWLNEAITEWYAQKLSEYQTEDEELAKVAYKGSVAYINERKELDRLFAQGLPEELVLAAYFENIDDQQVKETRGRALAALLKAIAVVEQDSQAVAKLENTFTMQEARRCLRNSGFFPERSFREHVANELPSGQRLYPVTFSVGIQAKTRRTETFIYSVRPRSDERTEVLGTDYDMRRMKKALDEAVFLFGDGRCTYSIGEPEIVT